MDIYSGDDKVADVDDQSLWAPPAPLPPALCFVLATLDENGSRWVEPAWVVDGKWCDMYSEPLEYPVVAWCKFPEPSSKALQENENG